MFTFSNPGIAAEPICEITRGERDLACECMTCQEYRKACKAPKTDKILYCIAFSYWSVKKQRWISDMNYTHAKDIEEARLTFFQSETAGVMRRVNMVGIAPVIGYFVDDNKGQELSV